MYAYLKEMDCYWSCYFIKEMLWGWWRNSLMVVGCLVVIHLLEEELI